MASHIDLGITGETIAKQYLESKGYEILFSNWRHQHKEVDIICKTKNTLIFIEVKTRTDDYFQQPFEAVENQKMNHLIEAAEAFIENYTDFEEMRFDILSIIIRNESDPEIVHIIDAFIPGIDN